MRAFVWAVFVLGCHRAATRPFADLLSPDTPPSNLVLEPVTGPAVWTDDELTMGIPAGWRGYRGPDDAALLLSVHDAAVGVSLEIWSFARSGELGPRPRDGYEVLFRDEGEYRSLPGLDAQVAATSLPEDPAAPIIQGYYAWMGDREVHVEVLYRPGSLLAGQEAVRPLLQTLRSVYP